MTRRRLPKSNEVLILRVTRSHGDILYFYYIFDMITVKIHLERQNNNNKQKQNTLNKPLFFLKRENKITHVAIAIYWNKKWDLLLYVS